MSRDWFSAQYAENSTRDWVDRMKAGAVSEARSPLNEAIDCALSSVSSAAGCLYQLTLRNDDHEPLLEIGTAPPSTSGMFAVRNAVFTWAAGRRS